MEDANYLPFHRRPGCHAARNNFVSHYALRQRVHAREVAADEVFIYHRDSRAFRRVLVVKAAPFDDTDSEGFEISGRNRLKSRPLARGWVHRRRAGDTETPSES